MKFCLALLVDNEIHNYSRKLAYEFDKKYSTGFVSARLPQHITLGPVFEAENIEDVEKYFDNVVKRIKPFEIKVTNIDLKVFGYDKNFSVIWMNIEESVELRELHDMIYKYINEQQWVTDNIGEYNFHSTIVLGEQSAAVYKEMFNHILNKKIKHNFIADEIALFCSTDSEGRMGTYITYKILKLGN